MKNTFLALFLSLSACFVQAAPEQVSMTIQTKNSTSTIYAEVGDLTPISVGGSSFSTECTIKSHLIPTTSVLSVKMTDAFTATVFPIEANDKDVKAYVSMEIEKNDDMKGVKLDYDCEVPVGSSVKSTIGLKDNFAWGKPRKLDLESGPVTITFNKVQPTP